MQKPRKLYITIIMFMVKRVTLICEVVKQRNFNTQFSKENCFLTFVSDILCLTVVMKPCCKDITI